MLHLSTFVQPDSTTAVCDGLSALPGVRHVMVGTVTTDGFVNITAQLEANSADAAIALLVDHDVHADDVGLLRLPVLLPLMVQRRGSRDADAQVWAEVVGRAWGNSCLSTTDLVFMMAAGVIAGVGVLTGSSILVVGAMAISPDLLPITASAVGLVEHRWRLAARAGRSLVGGLLTSAVAACIAILVLRAADRLEDDIALADSVLGASLTTLGPGTALVAIAAGVAGMLAYERLGGAAVGVAISVTTIPAAAYVGVGVALGRATPVRGALVVLVTNVVLVVAASALTLRVQRSNQRRRSP